MYGLTDISNTYTKCVFFFILSLQDGVLLTKLITKYCPVDGINPTDLQVKSKEIFVLHIWSDREALLGVFGIRGKLMD